MGIPDLAAHMFVFYYAVISTITPPVALAAYAAAGIAGTDPFKTALTGFRVGIAKFVIPFYIIYRPDFILVGADPFKAVVAIVMVVVGIWALAGCSCGFMFRQLKAWERIILFACIPLTIPPHFIINSLGTSIVVLISLFAWFNSRKSKDLTALA
jgi:TRAP-type uncharacterized transport system fused permease subunit